MGSRQGVAGDLGAVRVAPAQLALLLGPATPTAAAQALADDEFADLGCLTNATRLWMHDPEAFEELFALIGSSVRGAGLSFAERGLATIVSTGLVGDTYCPLAWGDKLAGATSPQVAGLRAARLGRPAR